MKELTEQLRAMLKIEETKTEVQSTSPIRVYDMGWFVIVTHDPKVDLSRLFCDLKAKLHQFKVVWDNGDILIKELK
jgi:hypothetical protein